MALIIVGDSLRVSNDDINIQLYSTTSLSYVKIFEVDFDEELYSISQDKLTVSILPSNKKTGLFSIPVISSQGNINLPVIYEIDYIKDSSLVNSIERYYPTGMFEWDKINPKAAELVAVNNAYNVPDSLKINAPIIDRYHRDWWSYCSSQFIGIAMQLAISEYNNGNKTEIVVWTNNVGTVSSISEFLDTINTVFVEDEDSTTSPKTASVKSSRFPSSNTTQQLSGSLDPEPVAPMYIGGIVQNIPDPNTDFNQYGLNMTLYSSDYSPQKYNLIRVYDISGGRDYELKYGAAKVETDDLKFVSKNKVVYVGQHVTEDNNYFIMSVDQGTTEGKGFNDGVWYDGGSGEISTELTTWKDIQGMPLSNEVIYDKSNIDISELNFEFILPPYNRLLIDEQEYLIWLSSFSKNIQKIAIRYNGKNFLMKIATDDIFFTFEGGVGLGFDEGIFL